MNRWLSALFLISILAAPASVAQKKENYEKGFSPENRYQVTNLDHVNLFNGNLIVTIPIGGSYSLGQRDSSYALTLTYNSQLWDIEEVTPITPANPPCCQPWAHPNRRSNAGLGWLLTLGRRVPVYGSDTNLDTYAFESPDGNDHRLNDQSEFFGGNKMSTDGSYLRWRADVSELDSPEGAIRTFHPDGSLKKMTDAFGNFVEVFEAFDADGYLKSWQIKDNHDREHWVYFKRFGGDTITAHGNLTSQENYRLVVDKVVLQVSDDDDGDPQHAAYQLVYASETGVADQTSNVKESCYGIAEGWPADFNVPLLRAIELPDGSSYNTMTYRTSDQPQGCDQGVLTGMSLPTKGRVTWQYQSWAFPQGCESGHEWHRTTNGIQKRQLLDADGEHDLGTTTYERALTDSVSVQCADPNGYREASVAQSVTTTVTSPTGNRLRYWFTAWPDPPASPNGIDVGEYGHPQSRLHPHDSAARYLSTEWLPACASGICAEIPLRRQFIQVVASDPRGDHFPRIKSERTVFEDGTYVDVDRDFFDGFGHFRQTTVTGTFPGSSPHTTFTNYNPGTDENGNLSGSYAFGPSARWILNTFSEEWSRENDRQSLSQACFDPSTGMLLRRRTLRKVGISGLLPDPTPEDLLTVFARDGQTLTESHFGGDVHPLTNVGTNPDTCALHLQSSTADYVKRYAYKNGALESSWYDGITNPFKIADRTIDAVGQPSSERDSTALFSTRYDYDSLGRLWKLRPTGLAQTEYGYSNATTSSPAEVTATRDDVAIRVEYDALGRVHREFRSIPTGEVQRETKYDLEGRVESVSSWESTPTHRTSYSYDEFGRPRSITAPDGASVQYAYTGGHTVTRTTQVATSISGNSSAVTAEKSDVQGRLVSVVEMTGNTSAEVTTGSAIETKYEYDQTGLLTGVNMKTGAQLRTFTYDGRGFLLLERHPEVNGEITYRNYDAGGHAQTRIAGGRTLKFVYDGAERLTTVSEELAGGILRPLKEFRFDGTGNALGQLHTAIRHNELLSAGSIDVTETYDYDSPSGQMSKRTTVVEKVAGTTRTPVQTFEYGVSYDPLGLASTITMPTCNQNGCSPSTTSAGLSVITNQRTNGLLTSIPDYGSFTYHPSGMLNTVVHASTPAATDTYSATLGIPRPTAVKFGGGIPCSDITISDDPHGAIIYTGTTGVLSIVATSSQALSYQWYKGPKGSAVLVSGATGSSFTTAPLSSDSLYWVRVSNSCSSIDSAYAIVTVANCPFALRGRGPDGVLRDSSFVESSDYVIAPGAAVTLEVQPLLIDGAPTTVFHYSWSDSPGTDASTFQTAPIQAAHVVTVTVTGTSSGGMCTRTMSFRLSPCDIPVEVRGGSCRLSNQPEILVRAGTTIPLIAEVLKTIDPREFTDAEWDAMRFTWTDPSGAIVAEKQGSGGVLQEYRVPSNSNAVPTYLQLSVLVLGCTRTIKMQMVVLSEPACDVTTDPNGCRASCAGLIRVNGEERQFYAFYIQENVILAIPQGFPGSSYEWHSIGTDHLDQVVGTASALPLQMRNPGTYFVRGRTGTGPWTTSATLITAVVQSSPGITINPPRQEIGPGTTATLTVSVASAQAYEWRVGSRYDLSKPVVGTAQTLSLVLKDDVVFWCRVKQNGQWANSSVAEVVTRCTGQIGGVIIPHPQFVAKDGFALVGAAPIGKIRSLIWYERNVDSSKTTLTGLSAGAINFYPTKGVTTLGADLIDACGTTGALAEQRVYLCVPTITLQPQNVIIPGGTPATLTTAATPAIAGQPLAINWYAGADQQNLTSLSTGGSFTTPPIPSGEVRTYKAAVKADCATGVQYKVDSAVITVEACTNPVITTPNPFEWSMVPGNPVGVSVSATGSDLTYQWYQGASSDTAVLLEGKTAHDMTVYPLATTSFWCRIKSRGVCVTTAPATIVHVCSPPPIAAQPQSVRVFANSTATLSVTADPTGNMEPITFQWQKLSANGIFIDVLGATASTFTTPPMVYAETAAYRVVVSAGVCTTASQTANIDVCTYSAVVGPEAPQRTVTYNGSAVLTLPQLTPVQEKTITWYRGQSGDRTQPLRTGVGMDLAHDTGSLTQTGYFWAEFTHLGCVSRTNTYTVRVCVPEITTQPVGSTVPVGTPATLTVVTTPLPEPSTYQWYVGTSGQTSTPVAGAISATLTTSPSATTTYWCRVTSACGLSIDSQAATIATCTRPQINATTPSQSVPSGAVVSLYTTVTNINTTTTYQWYRGVTGDTTTPILNGALNAIDQTVSTATSYWCRIINNSVCNTDSAQTTITICAFPAITTQPLSRSIFPGSSTTLSVAASSNPTPTYQWYIGTSGDLSAPIAGATGASLTVQPTSETNYWVRITNGGCKTNSATATLSICVLPPQINASPAATNIASGQTVFLSLPSMTPVVDKAVSWYRGGVGDRSTVVGAGINASYSSGAITQSTQYWAEFAHNGCISSTTAYSVNVCKPTITTHPQSLMINGGDSTVLSVVTTGSPLTYQWYTGTTGNTATPISGATAASYTAAPATDTSYWVRASGCTTSDSATATVSLCLAPTITGLTKSGPLTSGGTGNVTVTATGPSLTYQWYRGRAGDVSIPVSTNSSYTFATSTTQYYWVRVRSTCTNGVTRTVDSAEIAYGILPIITQHPVSTTIPSGGRTLLGVTASGSYLSYQWYSYANNAATAIAGATDSTYFTPVATTMKKYYAKVLSGPDPSVVDASQMAQIDVCNGPTINSFTSSGSNDDFTFTVTVPTSQQSLVTYHWYSGTPSIPSQSVDRGEGAGTRTFLNINPIPATFWVRASYTDGSCYQDTIGRNVP